MRNPSLKALSSNVEKFFLEFRQYDLASLSEGKVDQLLRSHQLSIDEILESYSEEPKFLGTN